MVGPFLDLLNLPTLLLKNFFFYLKKNNSFQKNVREMSKAKIISFICFVWKSFFLNWALLFSSQKWEKISLWVFCFSRLLSFSFPGVFAVLSLQRNSFLWHFPYWQLIGIPGPIIEAIQPHRPPFTIFWMNEEIWTSLTYQSSFTRSRLD